MSKLAIHGGSPVISVPLPHYNSMGKAELDAVTHTIGSGCLSGFYGSWSDEYFGGPQVREFERLWAQRFNVDHAVSVNSATSGLYAAMGAIGLCPGDEVIVPPYTMSATVIAPLIYGGIPVFVDIEPDTFCLDIGLIDKAITSKTKAVIAVNLFGQPADLTGIRELTRKRGLYLIEDNAQAPFATQKDRFTGTIGDIGIFSLNYHKHIHTGEGGICVTNDGALATRLQMIRNHAENVVEYMDNIDMADLIGFNYRMTEMSAAVGTAQLASADTHVNRRVRLAEALTHGISGIEGITPPVVRKDCTHVYYIWAIKLDSDMLGCSRKAFSEALSAEGFPNSMGYVRPLYMLPVFQRKIAFGKQGWPFNLAHTDYAPNSCPVTEALYQKQLLMFEPCMYHVDDATCHRLVEAILKVYENRRQLGETTRDVE